MVSIDISNIVEGQEIDVADVTTPLTELETAINNLIDGTDGFSAIDVNGGAIDGAAIGANSASTGAFTTLTATDGSGVQALNGSNVTSGTVAAARVGALPASKITTGTLDEARIGTFSSIDVDGGAIDDATIGANSAAAGSFTTLNTSGEARLSGEVVSQSNDLVVRAATAGGVGVGSNPNFWLINGDRAGAGVGGYLFFFDNFSTGAWQLVKVTNGAYGTGLIQVDANGVFSLMNSTTSPGATGYPYIINISGEIWAYDSGGTGTQLTSHPDDVPFDTAGRASTYVIHDVNTMTGKRTFIDVYKVAEDLEASTGNQYIYEDEIPLEERENEWLQDMYQIENQLREELYA